MIDPKKLSILLVDSDRDTCAAVKGGLEPDGFLVMTIPAVKEAMSTCQAVQFDLLVIDPLMPHARRLVERMARWNETLRVLFVSAYSHGTLMSTGLCPQGADILRKPFTAREINSRVRSSLALGKTWKDSDRSQPSESQAMEESAREGESSSLDLSESA